MLSRRLINYLSGFHFVAAVYVGHDGFEALLNLALDGHVNGLVNFDRHDQQRRCVRDEKLPIREILVGVAFHNSAQIEFGGQDGLWTEAVSAPLDRFFRFSQ